MPRTRPLPGIDRQVCSRLVEFRKVHCWTRREVAQKIELNEHTLEAIESAKAPVRFDLAWKLKCAYQLSLIWLATGKGDMTGNIVIPPSCVPNPRMSFSEAWDKYIRPAIADTLQLRRAFGEAVDQVIPCIADGTLSGKLTEITGPIRSSLPERLRAAFDESLKGAVREFGELKKAGKLSQINLESPEIKARNELTEISASVKSLDMSTWRELKTELKKATKPRGQMSAMADYLGVSLATVSLWLSDSRSAREPGANYALRMMAFLRLPSAKTNKRNPHEKCESS